MADLRKKVVALALLSLAFGFACFAQQTITVPDDYPTIQAAIDAAEPRDTVYVRAGRYTENIVIEKPLRLVGESRSDVGIEANDPDRPVVSVRLDGGELSLEDLAVSGGKSGLNIETGEQGIVHVIDVLILENETGVSALGEGSVVVDQCLLIDNNWGLLLAGAHTEMVDSEIDLGGFGVILAGNGSVTMSRCLIGLAQTGVSTYTSGCGWESGSESYSGTVNGDDNRIFGTSKDLCPERRERPWPEGFTDGAWRAAVVEIVTAYNEGVGAYQAQDYSGSLDAYSRALSLFESTGASFPLLESYVLKNIGIVYTILSQYKDALEAYRSARAVYVEREMDVKVAGIDNNIGVVYRNLGQYEDALKAYRSARAVYVEHEMEVDVVKVEENIGVVYWNLGQYEDALEAYRSARAVYVERKMEVNVAKVEEHIGVVYEDLGQYEDALKAYRSARVVYVEREMEVNVAKVEEHIGNVYDDLGQYEDALEAYRSARAVYVEREMEVNVAGIDNNIGVVYKNLGQYEDALEAYRSARAVYVEREMEVDVADIDNNIGVVYKNLGQYEDALKAYRSARAVYVEHEMEVNVAGIDQNIGGVYWNLGQYEDALEACRSALDVLDETPPLPGMTYSYPATRWMLLNNMGAAHEALKEWKEARESYEDSIAVIESLRGYMKSEELKSAWQEQTKDVYEHLIKLLINHGQGASAFPYAERCRARTFLDALYQGSIAPNQLISPEAGISSGAVDPAAIDAAVKFGQGDLQLNEAVLEYFVTDDGIYLWVITKDGISEPIFIEYSREQLMNDVITLRKALESSDLDQISRTQLLRKLLTSFYTKLVKTGLDGLPDGVDTLILIPSGPLWYLPFSALIMIDQELPTGPGATRHPYLVEHYTLAYLPSLASLSSLTKGETGAVEGIRLLALADPELSPDQLHEGEGSKCGEDQPLARYEQLVAACQAFADLLVGEEQEEQCVYAGKEAQEVRAHEDIGRQVVVYAAHGQFNPYVPLQSKLLLAPGGKAANLQTDSRVIDGNYHAWEALLTDYRGTKLVILAACETLLPHLKDMKGTMAVLANQACDQVELTPQQLEQIVVGDEVVGLARAFLSSGAEAVLGTLWLANPTAIGKLLTSMADYHKNEGDTWVQALTKAQRELIKNNTFNNPWFWAPYQLIGRWR